MIYSARHLTRYSYEAPVAQCMTQVRLRPRACETASVIQRAPLRFAVDLEPGQREGVPNIDYFGNHVITYSIYEPHERLSITATSLVEVEAKPIRSELAGAWEQAIDFFVEGTHPDRLSASEFRFASPLVPLVPAIAQYARRFFTPGRNHVEALLDFSAAINKEFKYSPKTTAIDTPLETVFASRKGVCQDYAHIMLSGLRGLGLPARYVSGYLKSSADLQGAEASHAWVSAYVPGLGWLDLDPTNNLVPSEEHITLAWGRDFRDVTPVKGVTVGGGDHTITVAVRVDPAKAAELPLS